MNHACLLRMTDAEIDEYGRALGLATEQIGDRDKKIEYIESARERTADVSVLGVTVTVPIKRMHDQRFAERRERVEGDSAMAEFLRDF